jgi:8-oxo-dGTP pyrophosphatase MutT (NUDIX family)
MEGDERPEQAAVREVKEETGLAVSRLYNVTVQPFYLHAISTVQLSVVFAAFVDSRDVTLSAEHQDYKWLATEKALRRFAWPREAAALRDIIALVGEGDAGAVEDVLRVF